MKRKNFIFVLSICMCLGLTSCGKILDWCEEPANAKIIGAGYIQEYQEHQGDYFVEIDSVKYIPDFIYFTRRPFLGNWGMPPLPGIKVTCFNVYNSNDVRFIIGDVDEEYLENYFTYFSVAKMFLIILTIAIPLCFCFAWMGNYNRPDTQT